MQTAYIEKLYNADLITAEEYAALKEQHKQAVSLFTELHILLYAGVISLATGACILIYKNIDSIGHNVVVTIIALLSISCFVYCFKKSPGFSFAKQSVVNQVADYILLLGCLLMLTLTAYLQYQYNLFGNHWGLTTFIPMVLLFLSAYYFDHPGILSLAITNLAAWVGITVTPLNILKSNDFSNPNLIYAGIILGAALFAVAWFSEKNNIKKHFTYTYRNFSVHLLFICLLAGMFYYDAFYFIWFAGIAGLTAFIWRYMLSVKSFYFFIVSVLYCYIALSYVVCQLVFLLHDELAFYLYIIWFIVSGILLIRLFIHYNKMIKQDVRI